MIGAIVVVTGTIIDVVDTKAVDVADVAVVTVDSVVVIVVTVGIVVPVVFVSVEDVGGVVVTETIKDLSQGGPTSLQERSSAMTAFLQQAAPPERFLHPRPPHFPHSAGQHASPLRSPREQDGSGTGSKMTGSM